jgi:hypothetical protein
LVLVALKTSAKFYFSVKMAYGVGAKKILHGMYERAVTAWHLHNHPGEAENFVDFGWVREYQFMKKKAIFAPHPEGG